MNLFAFSSILVVIANMTMAVLVLAKSNNRKLSSAWAIFCLVVILWGLGAYKFSTEPSKDIMIFWLRIGYIGVIFTPVMFLRFICEYLKLNRKYLFIILYILTCIFIWGNLFNRDLFIGELQYIYNQFYYQDWLKEKSLFFLFFYVSFYWILLAYSFYLLVKYFKRSTGLQRQQLKGFIIGMSIGWIGPHGVFAHVFGIKIYPYTNFLIAFYSIIIGYVILRHHLLDINIVIKKGLVYSVLATVITAGYLIFVIAIGRLFQNLVGYQSFIINLFAIFAIAIVFNPLRSRIQRFLDRRFFKGTLEILVQEQERLREKLFQAEKLAYVGNLASSVAHEIRNPLTAIKTFIEYFPQKSQDPEFKEKFQKFLPKEIERIERVVNQLLDLSKPRQSLFASINIVNTIDTTLSLLENNLKLRAIEVKRDYLAGDALIQADEEQLKQVFLNLFLNALQAMNEGGSLNISINLSPSVNANDRPSTSSGSLEGSREKSRDELKDTNYRELILRLAQDGSKNGEQSRTISGNSQKISGHSRQNVSKLIICVSDTGCGISEVNLKQLFTPFFTTKKEGVGLGLIVSQEIIRQHNGSIKVESEVGKGTLFTIELPVAKI